jgi:ABC-type proline/glycine betaine transport system ATPase subunit
VLSAADFLHWAEKQGSVTVAASMHLPRTCAFWVKQRDALGREVTLCTLPPGACSLQVEEKVAEGEETRVFCREPYTVPTDWQVVETEELPENAVRHHMTKDVVTVSENTPMGELAQTMLDAHIHRLIVVDSERRPVGVISSADILAAVARYGR